MTTIDATKPVPEPPAYGAATDNYLTHSSGFMSWAGTLDHKRIGVMYLVSVLSAFFLAGLAGDVLLS